MRAPNDDRQRDDISLQSAAEKVYIILIYR